MVRVLQLACKLLITVYAEYDLACSEIFNLIYPERESRLNDFLLRGRKILTSVKRGQTERRNRIVKNLLIKSLPLFAVLFVLTLGFTLIYCMNTDALSCSYLKGNCDKARERVNEICDEDTGNGEYAEECNDAQERAGADCARYWNHSHCP